jgi:hypothetical protein
MFKHTPRRVALAVVLFAATYPSAVFAQQADADAPDDSYAGTYNGPVEPGSAPPLNVNVDYGKYHAAAGAGNGAAGAGAGTLSNGHSNSVGTSTQAPGEACTMLPGTDIPYDCSQ